MVKFEPTTSDQCIYWRVKTSGVLVKSQVSDVGGGDKQQNMCSSVRFWLSMKLVTQTSNVVSYHDLFSRVKEVE